MLFPEWFYWAAIIALVGVVAWLAWLWQASCDLAEKYLKALENCDRELQVQEAIVNGIERFIYPPGKE
jgi:hypothetical protein